MTRRTTRIAALGAGALLALGFFSAAPAGASDGAQANATVDGATVNAQTTDVLNQTLDLVNQACVDAGRAGEAATSAAASPTGISVASQQAGSGLNLAVSLPALTDSLPALDSLPILGSLTGRLEAQPLKVSCTASSDGSGIGLSAAGVEALVSAIVPGVDVSSIIPSLDVSAATAPDSAPAASATANAAGSVPIKAQGTVQSPSVRAAASAPRAATSTTAAATTNATPASASSTLAAQTLGSPGALARTGAGVGALGLLGTFLFGSGRFLAVGRKLIRR